LKIFTFSSSFKAEYFLSLFFTVSIVVMAVSLLIVGVQFLGIFPFESVNKQREGKIECNKK